MTGSFAIPLATWDDDQRSAGCCQRLLRTTRKDAQTSSTHARAMKRFRRFYKVGSER